MNTNKYCDDKKTALKGIVKRPKILLSALHDENFRENTIRKIALSKENILDFGKSTRNEYKFFKKSQIKTADISKYDGYPDLFIDICDFKTYPNEDFDCAIFLAILEHVYDPFAAVDNVYKSLKPNGMAFCYAPFLYRYHAPLNDDYSDFFRFSVDGLAYLFRNFSEVQIYPVRGRVSTAFNIFSIWKHYIERILGFKLNRFIDAFSNERANIFQASGYYVIAIK